MLLDLDHEFEVLRLYFEREAGYVTQAYREIPQCADVEDRLFHPAGPVSSEDLLIRMTITEANALIEAALQDALTEASDDVFFAPAGGKRADLKYIFDLKRNELEDELMREGIDVSAISSSAEAKQIKEICEGYKHRQRLRPTPKISASAGMKNRPSLVAGALDTSFAGYEFELDQVRSYLRATKVFLEELQRAVRARRAART